MKRKLMIACAALLLGGVVGLMANQSNQNSLTKSNIEAFTIEVGGYNYGFECTSFETPCCAYGDGTCKHSTICPFISEP